jgi:hypothetical protein
MRIRGFLLVEAVIFVFIMVLSFIVMSKVMLSYSQINEQSMVQRHEQMLTNTCAPGHSKQFQDYCKKYNIKIIKPGRYNAEIEIYNKRYKIDLNANQGEYILSPM